MWVCARKGMLCKGAATPGLNKVGGIMIKAREAYGEQRWIGFVPIGQMIYCVAFTEENDCYRISSLRGATNSEKRTYIDHI